MRLKVEHITTFEYTEPVYETATEIRLRPCSEKISDQRLIRFDVKIDPHAPIFDYVDFYGNSVSNFNLLQLHTGLTITSTAEVTTGEGRTRATEIDELRCLDFVNESTFVQFDDRLREFAHADGRGAALEERLKIASDFCNEINRTFTYEPGFTDVDSTSAEVIQHKRGVCQDFAHVLTAACRVRGIPARYVSGYLYGGALSERDDRASHAWCEVYTGPNEGWIGLDPTHDTMWVDERYIKIGIGRDYSDIPPVKGTYRGNAVERLNVIVHVTEV